MCQETLFIEEPERCKKKIVEMGNCHHKSPTGGSGGGLTRDFDSKRVLGRWYISMGTL